MKFNNRYFILRHGQTTQQIKRKKFIYSWPDVPPVKLTNKGIGQIKKAARELKKYHIDLIYSSDINRTKQTAGIVVKELGLKINFDKRLRDINLGVYHGRLREEFFKNFSLTQNRFHKRPKRGESWDDVRKRILNFLKEIDKKYKNKRILIISHGDPLWLLEGIIKGSSNQELLKKILKRQYIKVGELRKIS